MVMPYHFLKEIIVFINPLNKWKASSTSDKESYIQVIKLQAPTVG